jgi:hypothetical protein
LKNWKVASSALEFEIVLELFSRAAKTVTCRPVDEKSRPRALVEVQAYIEERFPNSGKL